MKCLPIFLILLLLLPLAGTSQSSSLLWRVSHPKHTAQSYLFASTAFPDKRVFTFNDSLPTCLKRAQVFAPQIELNATNMQAIAEVMLLPDHQELDSLLTKEQYLLVKNKTEQVVKESFDAYKRFKPFALMNTVMYAKQKGDSKVVLTNHLQNIAEKGGKTIMALETVEGQLKYWELLPQAAVLAYFERPNYYHGQQTLALNAYLKKDLDKVLEHSIYKDKWTGLRKEILKQRNHALTTRMISMFEKISTFATVDAVHLASKHGVIAQLRNEGWTVEPIIAPATQKASFIKKIEWKQVKTEQNFSFTMPGEALFDEQMIDSELGLLKTASYRLLASDADPNVFYGLTFTDYPAHIVHSDYKDMWDDIFNNSGDALIVSLDGEFIEESNISLRGYPGRETLAKFDHGEKYIKFHSYLVGNRLFILQVITTRDRINNKFIGKYFDSFTLDKIAPKAK